MNQGKLAVFNQEMLRVNIDILGISELKWTAMGEFNSDEHYQQIWKTQQWPQDWKRSVFIPIPKRGNAKEYSNYRTMHSFPTLAK